MDRRKVYKVAASDYPDTSEDEQFRLSTSDYLSPPIFMNFCLYFSLSDDAKDSVIHTLQLGLAHTLGQCRSLLGTIERNDLGEYSIVVKRSSTVDFIVQYLDDGDHGSRLPSFVELERANFTSTTFRTQTQLCADIATSTPVLTESPSVLVVQANFLHGGMALTIHFHHWALDFVGFGIFVHQWAENTKAVLRGIPPPQWDSACLDRTHLGTQLPQGADDTTQYHARPATAQHPVSHLLFHLPNRKAQTLKALAQTDNPRISSYDAFTAMWWRLLTRHRARTCPDTNLDATAPFFEAVNMRPRLAPPLPPQYLGNALFLADASSRPVEELLTLREVMQDAPLGKVAGYIRSITDSVDSDSFYSALEAAVETSCQKRGRGQPTSRSRPPMSLKTTDWRTPNVYQADFGFGRPRALRHLFLGAARAGAANLYIYPLRVLEGGEEVFEFAVPVEREAVEMLCADEDVVEWFDFVGVEMEAQ